MLSLGRWAKQMYTERAGEVGRRGCAKAPGENPHRLVQTPGRVGSRIRTVSCKGPAGGAQREDPHRLVQRPGGGGAQRKDPHRLVQRTGEGVPRIRTVWCKGLVGGVRRGRIHTVWCKGLVGGAENPHRLVQRPGGRIHTVWKMASLPCWPSRGVTECKVVRGCGFVCVSFLIFFHIKALFLMFYIYKF